MTHYMLSCTSCGLEHTDWQTRPACVQCDTCGSTLDIQYHAEIESLASPPNWQGHPFPLPIHTKDEFICLGEGQTPLIRCNRTGKRLGLQNLWAKLEYQNPTGSFKDRGSALLMTVLKSHGVQEIVEDSSGNAGASIAAYAARSGIKAHIFFPSAAPVQKITQIKVYGAESHPINGNREGVTSAAKDYCAKNGLVYASHNLSPFFIEGTKTFAYETALQFSDGLPDHIVMPVGNGSLFIGAWKGFKEMNGTGRYDTIPKMHCVQAKSIMPVVSSFSGNAWLPTHTSRTVAGGISVTSPPQKHRILQALKESGGAAVAVSDHDILRWQKLLATDEGIYAEPTAAVALAGLHELVSLGIIEHSHKILVPITGFGLKDESPSSL